MKQIPQKRPKQSSPAKYYSYGCYGAVYERNGHLPLRFSKYERRVNWPTKKAWKTWESIQNCYQPTTHEHNRFKGLNNGFTKDQDEERR